MKMVILSNTLTMECLQTQANTSSVSLTLDQMSWVVANYPHGGDRDVIANTMLAEGKLSQQQQKCMTTFKRAVTDFLKKDYFTNKKDNAMTVDRFVDILNQMKVTLASYLEQPSEHTDPFNIPKSNISVDEVDKFKYEVLFNNIIVIDHDYSGASRSDGTYITFVRRDIYYVVKAAKAMLPTGSVQFGCDFVDMPDTDLQLGHGGFYDFGGHYHPSVFVLTKYESKKFAKEIMQCAKTVYDAFSSVDGSYLECLCDAAYALENACNEVGMILRRCFAHVTRLPDGTRQNSKQGTKGSLARYLLRVMRLNKREMTKVNNVFNKEFLVIISICIF